MSGPKASRWRSISTPPGRLRGGRAISLETVVCQAALALRMDVLPKAKPYIFHFPLDRMKHLGLELEPCEASSHAIPPAATEAGIWLLMQAMSQRSTRVPVGFICPSCEEAALAFTLSSLTGYLLVNQWALGQHRHPVDCNTKS